MIFAATIFVWIAKAKGRIIMTNFQTALQSPYVKPEVTSLTEAEVLGSIEAWGISTPQMG